MSKYVCGQETKKFKELSEGITIFQFVTIRIPNYIRLVHFLSKYLKITQICVSFLMLVVRPNVCQREFAYVTRKHFYFTNYLLITYNFQNFRIRVSEYSTLCN